MKQFKTLPFLFLLALFSFQVDAQLVVNNGLTGTQLGEILAGENITVSNATISGNAQQYGEFTFSGDGLEVNSGVILSTGSIFDAVGPNTDPGTGTGFGGAGNPLLTDLAQSQTFDATVLEFEFDVQSDEIEFNFVFLSEEYNEYVNTGFNDVFAFYISGPGIVGEENLAVVPGTTTPVTINSINNDQFWQFYHDNEDGNTNIEFDGFTTLMTARKSGLQSCETYTLKLMIADAGDDIFDAAVLLQENSLVQASVSASSSTYSENNTALEGCIEANFIFQLDEPVDFDVEVPLTIEGTAINGVDYKYIDPLIIVPAGQTSATVVIESYSDGMTEGQETIEISFEPAPCQAPVTVSLFIDDFEPIQFNATETDASCNGENSGEVLFDITGGFPPYIINLTDTLTNQTSSYTANPVVGVEAGTYAVEIIDSYGCKAEDLVFGDVFNAGTTFLPTGTGVTYETSIEITGFDDGETIETIDQFKQVSAVMEHSYANDISITLRAPDGTEVLLKDEGAGSPGSNPWNYVDMGEPVSSGRYDEWNANNIMPGVGYEYIWNNDPLYNTMSYVVDNQLLPEHTYISTFGNELTDYYYPSGSYTPEESLDGFIGVPLNGTWTIIVTDYYILDNGYIFEWSLSISSPQSDSIITIEEPELPEVTSSYTNPDCGLDNGEIDITVSGFTPTDFLWSNGETTEDVTNLNAGTYTVNITGDDGCDYDYDFNLSDNGSLVLTATSAAETCVDADNGQLDLTVSGGTPNFSYSWNNGATTENLTGLAPGDYTVFVTDGGSCTGIETFTVLPATPINISAQVANENCGDQEGAIDIFVSGGESGYTYLWSNGENTQDIDELVQGDYTVQVTDANSCTAEETFTITNYVGNCIPDCDLAFTYENVVNETCGQANGEIDLTIFTSFSPYNVNWSSGEITDDLTNLSANDYTITVTDAEGCELTQTFTVENQTTGLEILATDATDETCGNGQGEINVTVNGGALPYAFDWSNGETTEDLTNLSEGSYSLSVTDANGCSANTSATITNQTGDLALVWGNATNEICGNSTGTIDIIVEGGNPFGGGGPWGNGEFYEYLWSNGSTSEDLMNISAGDYYCVVTDEDGCQITTPVYTVENEAGDLAITHIDLDNETCGNSLGEIELTITGGQTPYTFDWNTGENTQDIFNLSAGTYNNTITDANGCSVTTGNLNMINESGTLVLDEILTTDELCGNSAGEIDITISGGTTPYNYLWNTGENAEDLNALEAGNYSCQITDADGCEINLNTTIANDNGAIEVTNTVVTNEECGQTNGAVNITLAGAMLPINFNWNNGETSEDLTNISAGNYNCQIVDAMGCETSANATVLNNSGDLSLTNSILTNEQCGAGDGSINLVVSGSATPITFLWSNGETTEDLDNLSAGTYSCVITDANGCSISTPSYTVNNTSTTLVATVTNIENETCGSANGAIDLTITGGAAPITFLWSNGETTEDLADLSAGTYNYTISDNSGCAITGSAEVLNESGDLAITSFSKVNEICGNGLGSIDITVNGAMPFSFDWSNGETTEDISDLSAGTYFVSIQDGNGCEITSANYNILNDAGTFELENLDVTDEYCGNGLGEIDVKLINGATPIDFDWSNGETTEDLTNLNQGTYSCIATDDNGCELTYFATVNNNAGNIIVSDELLTDASCGDENGEIDIEITGGVEPYFYAWNNGETTQDLTAIVGGTYNCVISDSEGCSTSYSATLESIGGDFNIVSTDVTDENCNNGQGEINVTISGGDAPINYLWDNGAITEDLTGISAGTYSMIATDANGCEVTTSATVQNIEGALQITNAEIVDEECGQANGEIDITYEGAIEPVSIMWSNGLPFEDLTELTSGTYEVTITDANGCVAYGSYFVDNITNGFELVSSTENNETCGQANGEITLNITGGDTPYNFDWSNGATTQDISGLTAGTYSCEITDNVGCVLTYEATLTNEVGDLLVEAESLVNDQCNQALGQIAINVSGGTGPYTFIWNTGANTQNIENLTAGTYVVTVTDNSSCSLTQTFEIINENSTDIEFAFVNIYNDQCNQSAGAIEFDANPQGDYDYLLNGEVSPWQMPIFWDLPAGEYTISIVDNGCQIDSTIIIENESTFNIAGVDVIDEYCGDEQGEIDLTIMPEMAPYEYNWSNGATTQDISGLSAGTYTCEITKLNDGCSSEISVTVAGTSNIDVVSVPTNENCGNEDGEINLFVSGGTSPYYYDWSNGETTQDLQDLSAGTYTCEITDDTGCVQTITEIIENTTNGLIINLQEVVGSYCDDESGSIDILPVGGTMPYQFEWSNGETTQNIDQLSPGFYTVELTDNLGCSVSETYEVENLLGFAYIEHQNDFCGEGQGWIYFEPTTFGDYTYFINGEEIFDFYVQNLEAGEYTVSIVDGDCEISETVVIENESDFNIMGAETVNEFCGNEQGEITLMVGPQWQTYSYEWNNGENTQSITGLSAGIYTCIVTNNDSGCSDQISVEIENETGTLQVLSDLSNDECSASLGAITLDISSDGAYTVLWNTSETTDEITNLEAGEYSVVVTETATGCEFTETFEIISIGNFEVSELITNSTCETCADGEIDLTLTPADDYTFNWSNSETTEDIFNLVAGNYSVEITNPTGCSYTNIYAVNYGLFVAENDYQTTLYPNPTNSLVTIDYNLPNQNTAVTIVDVSGKIVYQNEINDTKGELQINVETLKSGVYFVRFESDNYLQTLKLVKTGK